MTRLVERIARLVSPAATYVPGLQLVPRGAVALAEHVNRYYRVLTGTDAQNVAIRLPSGGSFQVRHSATNAAVLSVTDAGASVAGAVAIPPGSITTTEIANGTIADVDVNATAAVAVSKLAHVGAGNVVRSNGTQNVAGQVVTGDVSPTAGIVPTQLAHVGTGNVLKSNGTVNVAGQVANADVAAGANIAVNKLAHVGANNVLRSDGTQNVAGQVASADLAGNVAVNKLAHVGANNVLRSDGSQNVAGQVASADLAGSIALAKLLHVGTGNVLKSNGTVNVAGQIADADVAAGANISGSKLLDASVTSAKLAGGIPVPAGSITTTEIANLTILDADINAAAAIAATKLAPGAAKTVLGSNGTVNAFTGSPTLSGDLAVEGAVSAGAGLPSLGAGTIRAAGGFYPSGQNGMRLEAPVSAVVVAAGSSTLIGSTSRLGIVVAIDQTTGQIALFQIMSGVNTTQLLAGSATFWGTSPGPDNKIHCFYNTGNYHLYNGYAANHTLSAMYLGF